LLDRKEIKELNSMDFLKGPPNQTVLFSKNMSTIKLPTVYDNQNISKNIRLRKINRLGGGTYGRVYQATTDSNQIQQQTSFGMHGSFMFITDPLTGKVTYTTKPGQMISVNTPTTQGEIVAVKQNFVSPNFQQTIGSLRELDMLNVVKEHPYCIQLKNVTFEVPFVDGALSPPSERNWIADKVFFVLEKGEMDGDKYIRPSSNGTPVVRLVNERKLFAVQILLGIEFIHSRGICHRDLKPQNIICFLNSHGNLTHAKICDFGLTQYHCKQSMSLPGLVTLWYRAPEITLTKDYDYKVDVWSIGCILFELFSSGNRRFMQPATDESLIDALIERLPFPREYFTLAQQLFPNKITRSYDRLQQVRRSIEQQLAYTQSQVAQFNSCQLGGKPNSGTFNQLVDLIEKCLVIDPQNRYSTSQCLNHPFFDGYRELIDQTRTLYGINSEGEWILRPESRLIYSKSSLRSRGMQWFSTIYTNRMNAPISNWYSHRIFFHALEMFDRYLSLVNPSSNTPESDLVVWINTFMFMSAKYFRVMVDEFGLNYFATGIYPEEFYLFKNRAQSFEEYVVRDIFKCTIYQSTIFEIADDFLTETSIACLIKFILKAQISSGTPLKNIFSMYADILNQANRNTSPMTSPQTPVVSLISK
jgi:serine/threonine protein kinase